MMLNLVILFIAPIAVIIVPTNVNSTPVQELNVDDILDMLEKPQKQAIKQQRERDGKGSFSSEMSSDDSDSDDDGNEDDSVYGVLRNRDDIHLNQKPTHDKDKINRYRYKGEKDRELKISGIPVYGTDNNRDRYDFSNNALLEQLLQYSQIKHRSPRHELKKKHRVPHDLLNPHELEAHDNENIADLNNYSKIYIVLNPHAIQQSKSEGAINNLISKMLSMTSSTNERRRERDRIPVAKNNYLLRRATRDSVETYNTRDSMENYKAKHLRNDYGGGGGRTAIPYIRHRGDIYERDN